MKGDITYKILDKLKDGMMININLFGAILASGYGASMSKIDYEYDKRARAYEDRKSARDELRYRKRRLQMTLHKMKCDGLISEGGDNNEEVTISKLGKSKLRQLQKRLPHRFYQKEKQGNLTIVSFDIPERLRRKRNWLREAVRNLGFEMVHQSVWVGKVKIPKGFILDLEDLKILEYVEIFEVGKAGTLQKL